MGNKNESLNSLSYDEEGARHIQMQIADAYSSGVMGQEFGESVANHDVSVNIEE